MTRNETVNLGRLTWGLIGAALLLQVVIFVYAFSATAGQRDKVAAINRFIFCSLDRAEKTIPTLDYYKRHPEELASQLALIREQKAEFTPPSPPCVP